MSLGRRRKAYIPAVEWEWRRHFRTWQANRRVFLYPENYLEPELRDDKTPLFKELEDTLLQQQVTEQTSATPTRGTCAASTSSPACASSPRAGSPVTPSSTGRTSYTSSA